MYLLCCAILFALLSAYKPHRYEWGVLAIVTLLVSINAALLDHNGSALYWNRAVITFVGAMLLMRRKTTLGFYHSIILLTTLCAYGILAYHVADGTHGAIRELYKATIYGLVGCQFIAVFPTIWAVYRDHRSDCRAWLVHLQRDKRA